MANELKVTLDTGKEEHCVLKCKQNDDRTLIVTLLDNGNPYDLSDNEKIEIRAQKPDKTVCIQTLFDGENDFLISNNVVTLDLMKDIVRVAGLVKLEINIVDSDTEVTTFTFYLDVKASVLDDNNGTSKNTSNILDELNGVLDGGSLGKGCKNGLEFIEQVSYYGNYKSDIYFNTGCYVITKCNYSYPVLATYTSTYNNLTGIHVVFEPNLFSNLTSETLIYKKIIRIIVDIKKTTYSDNENIYFWKYNTANKEFELITDIATSYKNKREHYFSYDVFGYTVKFQYFTSFPLDSSFHNVARSGSYNDLEDVPKFSDIAYSGNYSDLQNNPWVYWDLSTFFYTIGSTIYTTLHLSNNNKWGSSNSSISIDSSLINVSTKKAAVFRFDVDPLNVHDDYCFIFDDFGTDFINAIKTCVGAYAGEVGIFLFNPNKETFSDELVSCLESIGSINISKNKNSIFSLFFTESLHGKSFYEDFEENGLAIEFLYNNDSKYHINIENEKKRNLPYINKNNIDMLQWNMININSTDFTNNEVKYNNCLASENVECKVINENNREELCKISITTDYIKITNDRAFNGKLLIKKI